eukprot:CAMPEP_0171103670 /NCGR_PEP_ID=MMETSP0766_2-20121228/59091_1 /TAXON_ID=439317 /ORGANISM="Gambierdiscus australes, Strain CAWD 149" /LENGTH=75 /DNA_ID=CAMNT_0011564131 /DNA_START=21 /DNA_END=244 /DNA_ORIENTATION=-
MNAPCHGSSRECSPALLALLLLRLLHHEFSRSWQSLAEKSPLPVQNFTGPGSTIQGFVALLLLQQQAAASAAASA